MTRDEISSIVKVIVADQLGLKDENIKLEDDISSLRHDVDSLDRLEIVLEMEDEFDVTISDEEAEIIRTINDAVNLIERLLSKK